MDPSPASDWTLLQSRVIRHTLREVFRTPDGLLVKRFTWTGSQHDRRRPWLREQRALRRLGQPVNSMTRERNGNRTIVTLIRDYFPGDPSTQITESDLPELAGLLASIHARGIVTCDPSVENFLRTPDGSIRFLDFGRSRVFRFRSPMYYFYLGKELARFFRTALFGEDVTWGRFQPLYFEALAPRPAAARMIRFGCRFWMKRWRERDWPPFH